MATVIPIAATQLALPYSAIADLCRRYDVEELAVFGSVLQSNFRPDSDVDFLVCFRNDDAGPWMDKLTDLQAALSSLLGRPVDLVGKRAVERSENYIRRRHILSTARVIYVA